jgi:DNA-binding NarL/FixJ family response regulator
MAELIRIVIADDDELFREALAMFLAELHGVRVVGVAADGREAVELARATRPDVVVLDLEMPVLDGFAAARRLRDDPEPPRIVICTGTARADLEREAEAAGAASVVRKGRIEDFTRALRVAIGGVRSAPSRLVRRTRADEQPQQDRQHD